MKEFYKSSVAKVYYDQALDTLFLEYTSKVLNDAQFIEINTAVLNAFTKLTTQKFVADIRKMGIIGLVSQQWVVTNLLPGMIAHLKGKTLYHAQLLDPKEVLSKVSASNIRNKSKQTMEGIELVQCTDKESLMVQLKEWSV